MNLLKWIFKWVVVPLVGLVVLTVGYFFIFGFRQKLGHCPKGHLAQIEQCEKDGSNSTWQGSGWYYFLGKGPISPQFCEQFKKEEQWAETGSFELQDESRKENASLTKVSCDDYFGPTSGACYWFERQASNGNSRLYFLLQTDESCQSGTFFKGSNRTLKHGNVTFP